MYNFGNLLLNKHSHACNYLPPYKFDVLKIVQYSFSCEMEANVEVTISKRATVLQLYYVVDHPKVGEGLMSKKLPIGNTFRDKRHLLILVAITLLSKELQFCNFTMW